MNTNALQGLRNRPWARRLLWTVAAVLLLWLLAWLAVPPIVKSQVEKIATEKLGRQVSLGGVDFKPWSLELTLTDLKVATADGKGTQLSVKRLYADAELESLLRMAPVIDAVAVDEPVLQLTHRGDGHYDIDDIVQKLTPPADAPASEPAQFALYNLSLNGGSLDFNDLPKSRQHTLRDLTLAVPFLSNLASKREVHTEPRLAFKLNGSAFDSSAQTTPFAQTHKTDASIQLKGFDLAPYLTYLPAQLPVRLLGAVLDADVKLAFEQNPQTAIKLSGSVQASKVKVADTRQQELLSFDALKLGLADVQPLSRKAALASVELVAPHLRVRRDKAGQLNLALADAPASAASSKATITSHKAAAPATKAATTEAAWQVSVAKLGVRNASVDWNDAMVAASKNNAPVLGLAGLTLDAADIALPFAKPLSFKGSTQITGVAGAATGATLQFNGSATDKAAQVKATLASLPLSLGAAYVAQFLQPQLGGSLDADVALDWKAASDSAAMQTQLSVNKLLLANLALTQGKTSLASIKSIELADTQIDPGARAVNLGRLAVTQPVLKMERDKAGHWMFEAWLKVHSKAAEPSPAAHTGPAEPAWKLSAKELLLAAGSLGWLDHSLAKPVRFELSQLRVQLNQFSLDGKTPGALQVAARLGAGRSDPGTLSYRGKLGLNPVATQGALDARHLPVHAFAPYFADALNVQLLRADTSFKGQVKFASSAAGPQVQVSGDTSVEDFRANSVVSAAPATAASAAAPAADSAALQTSEELLSWKILSLRGLQVGMNPGKATQVDVRETVLSDFFARVIIGSNGRINLQDLVKSSAAPSTDLAAPAPSASAALASAPSSAAASAPAAAASASATASGPAAIINFGPISLLAGKVAFSDRFVRPNYSADLSELTGKLSAFSSVAPNGVPQMADLELRGRAQGTASLEILGKLNPLAKPLALDIQGKVRDLELPPLTPYSIKYAGHGIERGKLSVDVAYKVLPDGQLTASNKLVLNQLTFGDKVEGAPASLPVKLAVALLADRNGVIDLDLPVSGSLNDPQFSLGPIIFKVIINIIGKALTSPFSLLSAAMGGGGDEMSMVSFAPGSSTLSPEAKQNLDKVAKALTDRPALKMSVIGTASLAAERDGYKRARLQALLQAEKRRAAVSGGAASAATETADIASSDPQYPALLRAVYRRADMPKPRNLVGMTKDIPPAEMEALLLANLPATDDLMRELAVQRGVAVKDYLASKQLPLERLFLGAAKTVAPEAKWSPRAELSLDTR